MKNLNFKVDKNLCIQCGLCEKDCSVKAITLSDNLPQANSDKCFGCQHCMAICPVGAISIFDKNPQNSFSNKNIAKPDEIEALIKMRRSCRHFKKEALDNETLTKLKDILNWTPTGCNNKGLHFAVVETVEAMDTIRDEMKKTLKEIIDKNEANGFILAKKQDIMNGVDFVFRDAPHMIVVSVEKNSPCKDIDPIIALSNFEIYAQSLNIGTLWCGLGFWTIPFCKPILDRIKIPENYELAYVMLFGKPDIEYPRSIQPDSYEFTIIK